MKRAERRTIRQSAYTIDVEFNGENVSPAISHDKRAEMGSSAFSAEKTDEPGEQDPRQNTKLTPHCR